MRLVLAAGAPMGTYTVAGRPSVAAAVATAMPWLPPDAVTTRSGRGPDTSALTAPRSLNDPPRCRCSSLNTSGRPSTTARSTGVRRTYGAIAAAASATEAVVGRRNVAVTLLVYARRRRTRCPQDRP